MPHPTPPPSHPQVAGSAAAVEAGDVALFSNDLRLLPVLVELSRRSRTKILENIAVAVVSKVSSQAARVHSRAAGAGWGTCSRCELEAVLSCRFS